LPQKSIRGEDRDDSPARTVAGHHVASARIGGRADGMRSGAAREIISADVGCSMVQWAKSEAMFS
jgi:hypothetical protein